MWTRLKCLVAAMKDNIILSDELPTTLKVSFQHCGELYLALTSIVGNLGVCPTLWGPVLLDRPPTSLDFIDWLQRLSAKTDCILHGCQLRQLMRTNPGQVRHWQTECKQPKTDWLKRLTAKTEFQRMTDCKDWSSKDLLKEVFDQQLTQQASWLGSPQCSTMFLINTSNYCIVGNHAVIWGNWGALT
jgi:hypothetical protein